MVGKNERKCVHSKWDEWDDVARREAKRMRVWRINWDPCSSYMKTQDGKPYAHEH